MSNIQFEKPGGKLGKGFTAGGDTTGVPTVVSAVTEKYDDIANSWTAKTNLNTARVDLAGFALNEIHVSLSIIGY